MAFPLLITLLPALAAAHYQVLVPTPLGTNIEGEETSPCGGYTPDLSSTHNVHVSGESFVMRSSHPQSNWLLRATLDPTANKDWVQIYPIFMQTGLGQFCVSDVGIPTDFVGQKGVVGIVANGGDGLLYQCISAQFVNGTGSPSQSCTNSTGVALSKTDDSSLSALLGSPATSGGSGGDGDDHNAASGLSFLPAKAILGLATLVAGVVLGW